MDSLQPMNLLIALVAGAGLIALVAGLRRRSVQAALARLQLTLASMTARLSERDQQLEQARLELARRDEMLAARGRELTAEAARRAAAEASFEQERRASAEKVALFEEDRRKLTDVFKALSADALAQSSRSFLDLARTALEKYQESAKADLDKRGTAITEMLAPVRESLTKVDVRIGEIERSREHAYGALLEQLRSLAETQQLLRGEAGNLVKALRAPQVRGRWGEIQLRRVVEIAGMVNYCDFSEQESVNTDGGRQRPDLIVRLPGGKCVVVDAKAPLAAYLEAVEAQDEGQRLAKLVEHARQVRDHVLALARKSYWEQFQPTPEFVVLFLPGETFFSAALEQDPGLLEAGAAKNVVLATPTTLIALLKAIAYGWRQEAIADNARAISQLGRELYKRLSDMGGHIARLGKELTSAVDAYNNTVGSLETRVLVSARRFKELEAAGPSDVLESLVPIEQSSRHLNAPELVETMPAALVENPHD